MGAGRCRPMDRIGPNLIQPCRTHGIELHGVKHAAAQPQCAKARGDQLTREATVSIRRRETKAGVRDDVRCRLPDGSKRIAWKAE